MKSHTLVTMTTANVGTMTANVGTILCTSLLYSQNIRNVRNLNLCERALGYCCEGRGTSKG